MLGQKCSAPHQHTWGARSYHNAIVCGIENVHELASGSVNRRLRVVFTNPTHREMLPCSFYLEGECKFDDEHCHFSHGELVDAQELGAYMEPDFTRLVLNCVVLAKSLDRLWHRGRVIYVNLDEKKCRVRLDNQHHNQWERDFLFEDLLPLFNEDDLSSSGLAESCPDTELDHLDDYITFVTQAASTRKCIFELEPTQQLGEWEKHTRGIGSKLMAKMGYIHGTGLGLNKRGIIVPVAAQILPKGCSLDRCMELREVANGDKNFFCVEKKLQIQRKKQEKLNSKAFKCEAQKIDVFSFLNKNVLNRCSESNIKGKKSLANETTKALNVANMKIADEIRRKEKEIVKLQHSMRRNAVTSDVYKRMQQQLYTKREQLKAMEKEERNLSKEQALRKTKDKLCVF